MPKHLEIPGRAVVCVITDYPEANPDFDPIAFSQFYELGRKARENGDDPFESDPSGFSYGYCSSAFRDGYYQRSLSSPIAKLPV